jgi:hypothetical protein
MLEIVLKRQRGVAVAGVVVPDEVDASKGYSGPSLIPANILEPIR